MVSMIAPVDYFPRPIALPDDYLSWPPARDFPPPTAITADDLPLPPARDSTDLAARGWDLAVRGCADDLSLPPARDSPVGGWDLAVRGCADDLPLPPARDSPVGGWDSPVGGWDLTVGGWDSPDRDWWDPPVGGWDTPDGGYSLDNPVEPIPRHALVSFVNAIAKQRQYVVVKEYLTKESTIIEHDSSVDVILDTLIKTQTLDSKFSKFNREAIWKAVDDRISEVRSRYQARMLHNYWEYLRSFDFIKRNSSLSEDLKELAKQEPFLGLNSHDKKHELKLYKKALLYSYAYSHFLENSASEVMKYYPHELPSENEKPRPPLDLIDNLVYNTLELDYVVDPNPEVELAKIKHSNPLAYNAHFVLGSRTKLEYLKYKSQRGTVRVENVSFDVSKKTIRRFFSQCGNVVDVELTSGAKSQTAFVTFSNPELIEAALNLKDHVIENQCVRIISIHEYNLKFLKAFSDVESDVVKDDDDMPKLLTKYLYYSKSCSKN